MDFEKLLSGHKNKACIMSVEKLPDDRYGNIRIVAGNAAHCDDMLKMMQRPFIPYSPYEMYFPKDKNFEDFCYKSAILGKTLHSYVELPQMGLWLNMFLLPLESNKEDTGYCLYSYEVTPQVDSEQRASLSADTSSLVLQTCIKLRGSNNKRAVFNEVVEDIRRICDSEHCCILLTDSEKKKCTNLAESLVPDCGLLPMDDYLDEDFYNLTLTWKDTIGDSTCLIIKDKNDMEWLRSVNPLWYESLNNAFVRNLVLFPLNYNDETLGYMWALNFNADNTVKIKETLELTSFFIASEIANYLLLQKLEMMGSMDVLTGVKNRNAMNNRIIDVVAGKEPIGSPYAVVFADLNGLKRVNDENGHDKGDDLLKRAASILQEVFPKAEIYRAGGDEFMLIEPSTDGAVLAGQVETLISRAEEKNVHFAVGTYIVREGEDIRTAMRVADERMYGSKKEYYENHPERKYR